MKKYLMMGAVALAMSSVFVSCTKEKDLYDPTMNAERFLQQYAAAFQQVFGDIAENQTWGFGSAASARATRGVFANGNEWAANDRTDCMYKVPPVLTEEQKAVVIKYFQTVKNPSYQDPQWTDYFIQQVYKGNPETAGDISPEQYKAANGSTDIIGSDHMDHLAAIDDTQNPEFVDHNNNFNHGDCGVYTNVLNYKGTLTTVEETYPVNSGNDYRHPDKINLMTNSTTKSFGYYNSNSSVRRTEYTGLVNFQTIIDALGAEANCLNDGWNRSFMGFDFEMMADKEMYATKKVDANGNEVWTEEYDHLEYIYFSIDLNGQDKVWNGTQLVDASTIGEVVTNSWGGKTLYPYFPGTSEKVGLLSENKNQYAGTPDTHTWTDDDWKHTESVNGQNTVYTSVAEMLRALNDSMLPSNNKSWVKIGGTADEYYSDWIVTLTKAEKYTTTTPTTPSLRVIAEDLSAIEAGDFDFNDVVFDVEWENNGADVKITIQAAGGTLPLYVNNKEVHAEFIAANQGAKTEQNTDIDTKTMINTNAKRINPSGIYSSAELENLPTWPISASSVGLTSWSDDQDTFAGQVRDYISIVVTKTNSDGEEYQLTLTAEKGKTPGKVGVSTDYKWKEEKVYIGDGFKKFVKDPSYAMWWKE